MSEYWGIPEGLPPPHRYESGLIWEGPGWIIQSDYGSCAIRVEADTTLTTQFADSIIPAVYHSGTMDRQVTVRFLAASARDCWELSYFCRPVILASRCFFAQELHSPQRVPWDRDQHCVESVFLVELRGGSS